ncbi:hypothetical protein D0Z00_001267 [Geotrichum galactomycetum]|uniref:Uncharacterized protein n=1 Tax=Geotrichum galactomycetum TaxID=27317 RepID=A0ACB6V7F5_9ASCO|nr:hypothetical protein D0Z00_001267 [Geotrichum candidum]
MLTSALEPLQHRTDRTQKELIARPDIADYLVLGFNAVNAALETQAQSYLFHGTKASSNGSKKNEEEEKNDDKNDIEMVFVCKADMKSALLSAHFPELVAAASAVSDNNAETKANKPSVRLIQLPAGSATRLAQASGLTQLSVMALRRGFAGAAELAARLESRQIGQIETPGWLTQARLMPPAIATLVTTAPIKPFGKQQKQGKQQQQDQQEKNPSGPSVKKQKS